MEAFMGTLCRRGLISARARGLVGVMGSMSQRRALPPAVLLRYRPFASSRVIDHVTSSGKIIDPYLNYYRKVPLSLLSLEGWQDRWRNVKSKLSSGVSFGHIKRHIRDFDLKSFPKEAQTLFTSFHEAYEKGDISTLASVCTDDLYLNLKSQLKMKNRPRRKALRFLSFTAPTVVVHGRHMYSGRKVQGAGFGQITCVLSSRREEYELDSRGMRVKDAPTAIFENESVCIYEVAFNDSKGRFRLASIIEQERKATPAGQMMMGNSGSTEPVAL